MITALLRISHWRHSLNSLLFAHDRRSDNGVMCKDVQSISALFKSPKSAYSTAGTSYFVNHFLSYLPIRSRSFFFIFTYIQFFISMRLALQISITREPSKLSLINSVRLGIAQTSHGLTQRSGEIDVTLDNTLVHLVRSGAT